MTIKTILSSASVSLLVASITFFGGMKLSDSRQEVNIHNLQEKVVKYEKLLEQITPMNREIDSIIKRADIQEGTLRTLSVKAQNLEISDAKTSVVMENLTKAVEKFADNVDKLNETVTRLDAKVN